MSISGSSPRPLFSGSCDWVVVYDDRKNEFYIRRGPDEVTMSMEPYDVGDVVLVRNINLNQYFDIKKEMRMFYDYVGTDFRPAQPEYHGRLAEITHVGYNWKHDPLYRIDIDGGMYWWDNVTLERYKDERQFDGIESILL